MDSHRMRRNSKGIRNDCDERAFQEHFSKFPKQLQACLKITGYNSVEAFLALKDTKQIEMYIRKKGDLIKKKNPELAETALGIDIDNPEEFEMPPGFIVILNKYINSFSGNDNKDSIKQENKLTKKVDGPTTKRISVISNGPIQSDEDFNGHLIWKKVSANIAKWCSLQPSSILKNFKHDQDYAVIVTPTKTSAKCLHCNKEIFLSHVRNKDTYVISNFTRHLKKCTGSTNKVENAPQSAATGSESEEASSAIESSNGQMVLLSDNNQGNAYETVYIIPSSS